MDPAQVLAVLDRLDVAGVTTWVDGGWGIDALVGVQTRPHEDLDLVIERAELPTAKAALTRVGYRQDASADQGCLLVDAGGRHVDFHLVVLDEHGNGWQPLGDDAWGAYPADGLGAVGVIAGRRVPCLTPELQLRHHFGYPLDDNDRHDLRLLADHFGVALPPDF